MEKHTELPVLQACAQLACTFCSDRYAFSSRAHLVFSQLLDSLLECFNTYLSGLLQVGIFCHCCLDSGVLIMYTLNIHSVCSANQYITSI